MALLIFKSLHIIGFVAWFAGMFYLVRLFVYHREADAKPANQKHILQDQYEIMQSRLYKIIMNPAMMFTFFCGAAMLILNPDYFYQTWLQVKLVFLGGLLFYHLKCKKIMLQMATRQVTMSAFRFRLFNELPTLFLICIVFLAIFKSVIHFGILFGSVILFGMLLFLAARWYRRKRNKQAD